MSMHAYMCKRRTYLLNTCSVLISSKADLSEKKNTNSISCMLHPLPCRKYMIKHFPHFIPFNSQSRSICCSPSPGPYMPISVPNYPSEILRLGDLLSLPPILTRTLPSMHAQHHTPTCHLSPALSMCCSLHVLLPFPPSCSHTLIKSPFCLLSTSSLQNLTIKSNP